MTLKMVRNQDSLILHSSLTERYANAGALSNPSRKRKRPAGAQSPIEVDNTTVDEVLPQIQNKTSPPNHQTIPPMQSDLPATSPCRSPSPLHTILQDCAKDKTTKSNKPKSKLTIKALRNAKAEVRWFIYLSHGMRLILSASQEPNFVDSSSDDEVPAEKRRKVAAGDGKKPLVTKEDPVFDAVFKSATSELKRQICFVNAFPNSTNSNNLPRVVYNHGVCSVKESGLYCRDDLRAAAKGFDGQWFSCVCPHTNIW